MTEKLALPYPLSEDSNIPKKTQSWFLDQDQKVFPSWTGKKKQYDEIMSHIAKEIEEALQQGKIKDRAYAQILWLFYHHSAQVAWLKKEREMAREKIANAVKYQEKGGSSNPYTRFLYFVFNDQADQAKKYAERFKKSPHGETFQKLLAFL